MLLSPVAARLREKAKSFTKIGTAADLAVAIERQQFNFAAYVVPTQITAGPNQLINAHSQKESSRFSVAYWVRNVSDRDGAAALDAAELLRLELISALCSWRPSEEHEMVTYLGGKLMRFTGGAVLWADEFTTSTLLRINP